MRRMAIAALLIALFALPAPAQNPSQGTLTRVRGLVDKLDGQTLTVKSREGEVLTIALASDVAIQTLAKKSLADIHPATSRLQPGSKTRTAKFTRSRSASFPQRRPTAVGNSRGIWGRTA
jgi:hypothetical protein